MTHYFLGVAMGKFFNDLPSDTDKEKTQKQQPPKMCFRRRTIPRAAAMARSEILAGSGVINMLSTSTELVDGKVKSVFNAMVNR